MAAVGIAKYSLDISNVSLEYPLVFYVAAVVILVFIPLSPFIYKSLKKEYCRL